MVDAIIVPGGGVRANGELPLWVQARFDHALTLWQGEPFLCLSAGTVFKPLPRDTVGHPIFESVAGATYLLARGVPPEKIFAETSSYDTIGNAYFARVVHTDPMEWRRLLIVTSDFHMARTEAIFRWLFGLPPLALPYTLTFSPAPDGDIEAAPLQQRQEKERAGLQRLLPLTEQIRTLPQFHHFLFTQHDAYAIPRLNHSRPEVPQEIKEMY